MSSIIIIIMIINLCLTISDAALTAVGDQVCLKWQKYLQFKSEIYYAYVSLTP